MMQAARHLARKAAFLVSYLYSQRDPRHLIEDRFMLLRTAWAIMTRRSRFDTICAPLQSIRFLHPLEHTAAIAKARKRADRLASQRAEIFAQRCVSSEFLARYLPSITPIRVVRLRDGSFVAYEGNGRLVALREVCGDHDINVEVQEAILRDGDSTRDWIAAYVKSKGL
jgi:hypothetical protein